MGSNLRLCRCLHKMVFQTLYQCTRDSNYLGPGLVPKVPSMTYFHYSGTFNPFPQMPAPKILPLR